MLKFHCRKGLIVQSVLSYLKEQGPIGDVYVLCFHVSSAYGWRCSITIEEADHFQRRGCRIGRINGIVYLLT